MGYQIKIDMGFDVCVIVCGQRTSLLQMKNWYGGINWREAAQ